MSVVMPPTFLCLSVSRDFSLSQSMVWKSSYVPTSGNGSSRKSMRLPGPLIAPARDHATHTWGGSPVKMWAGGLHTQYDPPSLLSYMRTKHVSICCNDVSVCRHMQSVSVNSSCYNKRTLGWVASEK